MKKEDIFKIADILNAKQCSICSDGKKILKFKIIKVAE